DFFERHVPAALMGALWELESQTDRRLFEQTGALASIDPADRVSGPGASIVMAAFTHIGRATRFSDGSYGVYYAGLSLQTAIRETVHHRELIARDAELRADEFGMRVWSGRVLKPLHDIRNGYDELHDAAPRPEDHPVAQAFGRRLRTAGSWGIAFRSVRHAGGYCIAALRAPAISLPTQGAHLKYVWDGTRITEVYERGEPLVRFSSSSPA
ncbi:MAG: RES family NAD+ phosphorylase, partial [Pseudomonadota bacterium]|nr:RES family NAD+ phosphorylase [Pseudomonadota bacterium]